MLMLNYLTDFNILQSTAIQSFGLNPRNLPEQLALYEIIKKSYVEQIAERQIRKMRLQLISLLADTQALISFTAISFSYIHWHV